MIENGSLGVGQAVVSPFPHEPFSFFHCLRLAVNIALPRIAYWESGLGKVVSIIGNDLFHGVCVISQHRWQRCFCVSHRPGVNGSPQHRHTRRTSQHSFGCVIHDNGTDAAPEESFDVPVVFCGSVLMGFILRFGLSFRFHKGFGDEFHNNWIAAYRR